MYRDLNPRDKLIKMAHPYQCLLYCYRPEDHISRILIAASGECIHVFDVTKGEHLSSWPSMGDAVPSNHKQGYPSSMNEENLVKEDYNCGSQPPSKRRKMSPKGAVSSESSSTEIVVECIDGSGDFHSNPVIKLAATSKGRHIVAVTGEDKCMRAFE